MRVGNGASDRGSDGLRGRRLPDGNGRPSVAVVLVAAGIALAVLVLAGCADNRAATPPTPARTSPSPGGPGPLHLWIAVFRTAEDPNELDAATQDLMDRVGTSVVAAPEGCFGGLRGRGDVDPGEYVLAVTAGSEDQLEKAVTRAGEEPVVTARVEDLCPM